MTADEHGDAIRLRADVLNRADTVDVRIQGLLERLDLDDSDPERERVIDAIMGLCLMVDAARAYARGDVATAAELATSMSRYADQVLDATE